MKPITELTSVQLPLVNHASGVGWTVVTPEESVTKRRGEAGLFHYAELESALLRLNPGVVTDDNVAGIIQQLEAIPSTLQGNREVLEWLRGARSVYVPAEKRRLNVTLIDYNDLSRNTLEVTYEWAFTPGTRKGNRADVVFLVNGIPVAIIENKNPKLTDAMERAVKQLRRYELETPELLTAPQVFNVTHLVDYFYGVTWNYSRKNIFLWKEKRSETFKEAVQSFFEPHAFLTMLKEWVLFYVKDDELQKTVLRQHQTRAAVKVVNRCADPAKRRGLVWHTQGSGKTFTLITAARLILEDKARFPGATVLLVVDRNELEGQLAGWVDRMVGEMRGSDIKIEYANTKARLQSLLDQDFRGLIISMIHKFEGVRADSCTRDNFFVLIDEAHRSTGGDLGNYLMGALPAATLIGFTGTPIDKTAQGQGTFKTFGTDDPKGYLDKYSITESIEDGTTLKLRHTLAPNHIRVPDEMLEKEFFQLAETEGISDIDELNRILDRAVRLKTFLKADERIEKVAKFVAQHFKENVAPLGYKAFLVAVDREACAKYKEALDQYLPAEWSETIYTKNTNDVIDRPLVAKHQVDEVREKDARKAFTKPAELPRILIVTDKLLTGYDAPILYCMYLDKPMRDHVLLQAVARVNRPYEDDAGVKKPCGLIIDFIGILKALNKAFSFDSKDVEAAIEDLDVLLEHFKELMRKPAARFLDPGPGPADEELDRLLYKVYFDKEKRQAFAEFYREVETLYEILSPDAALRPYISTYRRLSELYATLRAEYGTRSGMMTSELAHKTELLLRSAAKVEGLTGTTKTVEYDEKTLEALRANPKSDTGRVLNLLRDVRTKAEIDVVTQPALRTIIERVDAIRTAFEDRQIATQNALDEIQKLVAEQDKAKAERERLGMDDATFGIYWVLEKEKLEQAEQLAREIAVVLARFPNFRQSADELRQLKAELYKSLLKVVSGRQMVDIGDRILALRS
ncbi:MAG: HsdR family type I site-specific deoxyribonuclease [Patescibacteria group bacterium]